MNIRESREDGVMGSHEPVSCFGEFQLLAPLLPPPTSFYDEADLRP